MRCKTFEYRGKLVSQAQHGSIYHVHRGHKIAGLKTFFEVEFCELELHDGFLNAVTKLVIQELHEIHHIIFFGPGEVSGFKVGNICVYAKNIPRI
jgi:hypothetical protein